MTYISPLRSYLSARTLLAPQEMVVDTHTSIVISTDKCASVMASALDHVCNLAPPSVSKLLPMAFITPNPQISLRDYVLRFMLYSRICENAYPLALCFIDRIFERGYSISHTSIHKVFVAAIVLAHKYLDDRTHTNQYVGHVAGVDGQTINELEVSLWTLLGFNLTSSWDEILLYVTALERLALQPTPDTPPTAKGASSAQQAHQQLNSGSL